jgi:hypothetical protein
MLTETGGLRVCEPLFSGDPLRELNPTLDISLRMLALQVQWLHCVHERGSDVSFDEHLVLAGDALAADDIFALRGAPTAENDCGWSVAPVPAEGQNIDMSRLCALPVYRLIDGHPNLLSVLTLPEGYLVRLRKDTVVEVTDAEGRIRWPSMPV